MSFRSSAKNAQTVGTLISRASFALPPPKRASQKQWSDTYHILFVRGRGSIYISWDSVLSFLKIVFWVNSVLCFPFKMHFEANSFWSLTIFQVKYKVIMYFNGNNSSIYFFYTSTGICFNRNNKFCMGALWISDLYHWLKHWSRLNSKHCLKFDSHSAWPAGGSHKRGQLLTNNVCEAFTETTLPKR